MFTPADDSFSEHSDQNMQYQAWMTLVVFFCLFFLFPRVFAVCTSVWIRSSDKLSCFYAKEKILLRGFLTPQFDDFGNCAVKLRVWKVPSRKLLIGKLSNQVGCRAFMYWVDKQDTNERRGSALLTYRRVNKPAWDHSVKLLSTSIRRQETRWLLLRCKNWTLLYNVQSVCESTLMVSLASWCKVTRMIFAIRAAASVSLWRPSCWEQWDEWRSINPIMSASDDFRLFHARLSDLIINSLRPEEASRAALNRLSLPILFCSASGPKIQFKHSFLLGEATRSPRFTSYLGQFLFVFLPLSPVRRPLQPRAQGVVTARRSCRSQCLHAPLPLCAIMQSGWDQVRLRVRGAFLSTATSA